MKKDKKKRFILPKEIIEDKENNYYYKQNPIYFNELFTLAITSKNHIFETLNGKFSTKYKKSFLYLKNWIVENTPKLNDEQFTFSTRVGWILSGRTEFPICKTCGKELKKNCNLFGEYKQLHCFNTNCAEKDPEVKRKRENTCLKKYGMRVPNCFGSKDYEESCLRKYGVTNQNKLKWCRDKIKNTFNEKSKEELKQISNNRKQTCLEKYGHEVAFGYGTPEFKELMKEKYGVEHNTEMESFWDKTRKTNLEKYGTDYFLLSDKCHNSMKHCRYEIDGYKFDSKPEAIYYIYLRDHNIQVEPHPQVTFYYSSEFQKHLGYHPDFIVEGQYVEIKGDQFFNEDGTMRNPFAKSEESKRISNAKAIAKQKCMAEHNVKIIRVSELNEYNIYVKETYGKDYLKQFKTR